MNKFSSYLDNILYNGGCQNVNKVKLQVLFLFV